MVVPLVVSLQNSLDVRPSFQYDKYTPTPMYLKQKGNDFLVKSFQLKIEVFPGRTA